LVTPLAVHSGSASLEVDPIQATGHIAVSNRFLDEQLELFQRCYEEGYNIYTDHKYVRWLELHHPESLPTDRYSLIPFAEQSDSMLVTNHFLSISPEVPLVNAKPPTGGGDVLQSKDGFVNVSSSGALHSPEQSVTSSLRHQFPLYPSTLPLLPFPCPLFKKVCCVHTSSPVQSVWSNLRKRNTKTAGLRAVRAD